MIDRAYSRAPWLAILALAVLVGVVIGGMFVAVTIDRELAAARWEMLGGN